MTDHTKELRALTNETLIKRYAEAEVNYSKYLLQVIEARVSYAAELAHVMSKAASKQIDAYHGELIRRLDEA